LRFSGLSLLQWQLCVWSFRPLVNGYWRESELNGPRSGTEHNRDTAHDGNLSALLCYIKVSSYIIHKYHEVTHVSFEFPPISTVSLSASYPDDKECNHICLFRHASAHSRGAGLARSSQHN